MKKLINSVGQIVEEMIQGLVAEHAGLGRLEAYAVILRSDIEQVRSKHVALISGGGSGHEPAHAGFVGAGMLTAAVAGEVFTSPSCESILAAIHAVAGPAGVLLIVKNYTGDRLNFGLAAEMAKSEGISVEMVIVADDVALAGMAEQTAGRRGIAGTVFVHKVAGAAAAEGEPLANVARIARDAANAVASMGVSLSAGTVPAVGYPSFTLAENEVELGLGIHGEPGVERAQLETADALTDRLLNQIIEAHHLKAGENVALLVNNLGSTTNMELAIVTRRALASLDSRGIKIQRVFSGTFISSLDMAGVSLSVLRVDAERIRRLDAPTNAPAWPNASRKAPTPIANRTVRLVTEQSRVSNLPSGSGETIKVAIKAACESLIGAKDLLTEMDSVVGDGDLGITLARGSAEVLKGLAGYPLHDPAATLNALGNGLMRTLGGSSGPLYGVLFMAAGNALRGEGRLDEQAWGRAIRESIRALSELGGASAGDRTMLDALIPFIESFETNLAGGATPRNALLAGVRSAEAGAKATAQMKPRRGRSSYLGERTLGHPDPGAVAVAIWLRAVESSL